MAVAAPPTERIAVPETMPAEEKVVFTALATNANSLGEAESKEASEVQGWKTMKALVEDWGSMSEKASALFKQLPETAREPYGNAFVEITKRADEIGIDVINAALEAAQAEEKERNKGYNIEIEWGTISTQGLEDAAYLAEAIVDILSEPAKGGPGEETAFYVLTRDKFPNRTLRTISSSRPTTLSSGNNCVIVGGRLEAFSINGQSPREIEAAGDVPLIQPGDQVGLNIYTPGEPEPNGRVLINIE